MHVCRVPNGLAAAELTFLVDVDEGEIGVASYRQVQPSPIGSDAEAIGERTDRDLAANQPVDRDEPERRLRVTKLELGWNDRAAVKGNGHALVSWAVSGVRRGEWLAGARGIVDVPVEVPLEAPLPDSLRNGRAVDVRRRVAHTRRVVDVPRVVTLEAFRVAPRADATGIDRLDHLLEVVGLDVSGVVLEPEIRARDVQVLRIAVGIPVDRELDRDGERHQPGGHAPLHLCSHSRSRRSRR